jgi:hypothetical protein
MLLVLLLASPAIIHAQTNTSTGSGTAETKNISIPWDAPTCQIILGSKNRIAWLNPATVTTKYFSIQRSADGKTYTDIGRQQADLPDTYLSYYFEDTDPQPFAYYRICSVDGNNRMYYSPVIRVVLPTKKMSIRQSTETITIYFSDDVSRSLTLLNISGRPIMRVQVSGRQYTIPSNTLKAGIYLVRMETGSASEVQQFVSW